MLVFLTGPHFDAVAARLAALDLSLDDVYASVFPSRPEPARASFVHRGRVAASYRYVPDEDVRWLRLFADDPLRAQMLTGLGALITADLTAVAAPLTLRAPSTRGARRAACSLSWVVSLNDDPDRRAFAIARLAAALDPAAALSARRAAAEHLAAVASIDLRRHAPALPGILRRATEDPDLDVRLHARRALDVVSF
jgi:hypothetical protein